MEDKYNLTILRPITTSRNDLSINSGIKCIHYGDVYKIYDNKIIKSSTIVNSFTKFIDPFRFIKCDSIIMPDVTETISDFGHFVYVIYDGIPYVNGTHTFALIGEPKYLKYIFYNLQSLTTKFVLQQFLKGGTVFQINQKDLNEFKFPIFHENILFQQHIVDTITQIKTFI